jgi:hypothetical protein
MSNEGLITSALLLTAPKLYSSIDGGNSFRASLAKRGARTGKYRRYVSGDHDATLTTQMRKMLRLQEDAAGLNNLNINYMGIVVDKMAGRLNVNKVTSALAESNPESQAYIDNLLIDNDFEAIQGMMWRGAIRDGDSYVMVDPNTSKWIVEPGYDGFSGMFALMQQGRDYPVWACKLFSYADLDLTGDEPTTTVAMKVIVYQPDQISYFTGQAGGQEVSVDTSANIDGAKDGVKKWSVGVIPVIHYANLKDSFTQFGESEVRKGIAPQDVLNRTLHSMVMASEFSAFKITWSIGMEMDMSGITPGAVINLTLTGADGKSIVNPTTEQIELIKAAKVGQFEATDISQYTGQIEKLTIQISHVTSTPIYGVTTTGNLSGEALKQLETGLIGKCQRFQKENTSGIRSLIELTAKIQKTFQGFKDPPELGRLTVEWDSPELRDNVMDKEIAEKQIAWKTAAEVYTASNGQIPIEAVLKSFGFTEEEMTEFGTQKMASINQQQEDVVPKDGL